MDKLYEKDFGGANYRSRDPIKNFRIKVKLQRLSASTIGFVSSQTGAADGETTPVVSSTNQFGQTILDNEELVVQWQQKYFSLREMEYYGFEPNCTSVLDYKYHADVENIKKGGGRVNNRLFTYLDTDRFYAMEDAFVSMTTSPEELGPTDLAKQVTEVRRRKAAEMSNVPAWRLQKGPTVSGMKLIEEKPTKEFLENHHVTTTPVHTMVVMADLSPEGQLGSIEFERRICTVQYNDNGVIRITPDFTRSKPAYRIDEGSLGRDVWEFKIEHVSNAVSKIESRRETKIISELYRKHQNYLQTLVGDEFEEVPDRIFRLSVFGEILSAESFEYNDLHIEYLVDIPDGWSRDPTMILSGCTQTCTTSLINNIEKAYFCQPFNFQTFFPLENQSEENPMGWPNVFVHIISSDSWGRRRTEGYGYVTIPTTPAVHDVTIPCWRPLGNFGFDQIAAERRRFFIGGTPELEDVTSAAVPATFEGRKLAKYGVRTESTGSVKVRLNCIQQCRAFQDSTAAMISRKKLQNALQMARGKATRDAVHGVMGAFQRARKRMQLARESVPTQIREAAQKTTFDKLTGVSTQEKIKNILRKAEKQD